MAKLKGKLQKLLDLYRNAGVIWRASIWFICVTMIEKGVMVFTQPIISRILSVEQVGIYSVYNTWFTIFDILATLYLFCGALEVQISKNKENTDQIAGSVMVLCLSVCAAFFILVLIFLRPLSQLLRLKPLYLIIMLIFIASEAVVQFWTVPKRFTYRYKPYCILLVSLFVVKSILSVLLAYFMKSDRVLGRILGITIPSVLVSLVLIVQILRRTDFSRLTSGWKHILRFNLPLIPHYLAATLLSSSDRVMIQRMTSDTATGLYSMAYSFASLSLIAFNAIDVAFTPYLYGALARKDYTDLRSKTNLLVLINVVFSAFLIFFAPEGLFLLGGNKYLPALGIIPVLVVGIFISSSCSVFSAIEFVHEKTNYIFYITLFGTVVNIGLNYWLIPIFGYQAAAYTTLLGYLLIAICHYCAGKRILGRDIYDMKMLVLQSALLCVAGVLAMVIYPMHFLVRYVFLLGVLAAFVILMIRKKEVLISLFRSKFGKG